MTRSGSRIRSRFSLSLAAAVFTLAMGFTTAACADDSGSDTNPPSASAITGNTGSVNARRAEASADTNSANRARPRLVRIASFSQPVEIKAAPGFPRLMFVVEQEGRIMVLRRGRKLRKPFLDIRGKVQSGGERGLLSVGFPPNFKRSKRFYVYYTDDTGDIRVVEYRAGSAVRARPNTARNVITIPHRENSNHNGGQLQFLGQNLFFGTGDGGGGGDEPGNAQNLGVLLGKMIRIDPRPKNGKPYSVPGSNPFVGRGGRDEIYSYGLRNPFRWSFQRAAGANRMMIADVGQDKFEEINSTPVRAARGANFGWNKFEGFSEYEGGGSGTVKPTIVLPHPPNCSVIGGLVVRDRKVPSLFGRYIFSDFCDSKVKSFRIRSGRVKRARNTGISESSISSFAASASGIVYATSLSGPVFRLTQ